MKGKYYTIQIIPEDSKEIKKYRISTKWSLFLKIFLVLLIISSGVLIYNAGRIGKIVVQYEKMRTANAQLAKQNANYEELFMRIDSLWVLEERIQNILGTFIENDSEKVNSLIDKSRFAHTPSQKNRCRLRRRLETARRQGPPGTYSKRDSCCRNREQKIQ